MTEFPLAVHEEVLHFWFVETDPRLWWAAETAFDRSIAQRFAAVHQAAAQGELAHWRKTAKGRLAEVVVLDQFSRNLFRASARAYASDTMALALAQEAIAGGHDGALDKQERAFLYMPFMHSESRIVQQDAERLFASLSLPQSVEAARQHWGIIDRFGRYPHRNAVLGRHSTPAELEFLQQPGSRF